jgi:hypothetical protein
MYQYIDIREWKALLPFIKKNIFLKEVFLFTHQCLFEDTKNSKRNSKNLDR